MKKLPTDAITKILITSFACDGVSVAKYNITKPRMQYNIEKKDEIVLVIF